MGQSTSCDPDSDYTIHCRDFHIIKLLDEAVDEGAMISLTLTRLEKCSKERINFEDKRTAKLVSVHGYG